VERNVAKNKSLPPLSEAQLEIMNIVWDRGETTVGQVWAELSQRRPLIRNTVHTMVVRLEEKGWLQHRAKGNTFYYRATQPGRTARKRMLRRLLETAFHGSTEGLLLAILEDQPLSNDEAARVRSLIDQATRKNS
jgi:predicted transcriptional regulator